MKNNIFLPDMPQQGRRTLALFPRRALLFLYILLLGAFALTGCGDDLAPVDAVVAGPPDEAPEVPAGTISVSHPDLSFEVTNAAGQPVSGVEIEFQVQGTLGAVFITDVNRNATGDVDFAQTTTDDRGLATVSIRMDLLPCDAAATEDRVTFGGVTASVGVASATFTSTLTLNCVTGSGTP
jgi:hypothetical protein